MNWILWIFGLSVAIFLYHRAVKHKLLVDAVWNAYFAEHLLSYTELNQKNPFTAQLKESVIHVWRVSGFPNIKTLEVQESFNRCNRIQQLNILAMALNLLDQQPMISQEAWKPVRRPFIDLIGNEDIIEFVHEKLKAKYTVSIEIPQRQLIMSEWGISDEPIDAMAAFVLARLLDSSTASSALEKRLNTLISSKDYKEATQIISVTSRARKANLASLDANWPSLISSLPSNVLYNQLNPKAQKILIDELVGDAVANIIKNGMLFSAYSISDVSEKMGIIMASDITASSAQTLVNNKIMQVVDNNKEMFNGMTNYRVNSVLNSSGATTTNLAGEVLVKEAAKIMIDGLNKYADKQHDTVSPLAHEKILEAFIRNDADIVGISKKDRAIAKAILDASD